jgi:hypothetical protein
MAVLLLLCATAITVADFSPNLTISPLYNRLLTRLSSRYDIVLPDRFYLQPYTWEDIAPFIALMDSSDGRTSPLSQSEHALLKRSIRRFGPEKALYRWNKNGEDLQVKINLDLLGDVRPGYNDSATLHLFGIAAPSFSGNLGDLSFYSGIRVWTEFRSDTLFPESRYQPFDGIAYNLYGRDPTESSTRSSDLPRGGIRYEHGRLTLETAVDYLRSGPARYYPLTLSGAAPPITYCRAGVNLGLVRYQHIIGLLKVQKDRRKYLYMHRLSGNAWHKRILFGINEVVIYGNTTDDESLGDTNAVSREYTQHDRGFEWEYSIPLLPFKFVEHYAGDRDNAAVSVDVAVNRPTNWRWYGEFFLDDMLSPWKLFSDDWGNKWAVTLGGNWFGTLMGKDLTIAAEFSHVEPWVYTHFGGGSHRYSHFNACLGSPLGPNSQAAVFAVLLQVHPLHEVGVGFNHFAYNHTTRGGSITDIFQYPDSENKAGFIDATVKRFLGPGTVRYLQPELYWNFNSLGIFSLHSVCRFDVLDNAGRFLFAIDGGLHF